MTSTMTMRLIFSTVLVCAWAAGVAAADLPATLVDPYLRIQAALAFDKTTGVKQDATAIAQAAAQAGATGRTLAGAALKLERAGDLKAARAAFGELSDALIAHAKASGATTPTGVKQMFCPMVNKPWLQKGDAIKNPYYGSEMLDCGEVRK